MADPRREIVWAPSARIHLSEILAYIAEDSRDAARRFLVEVCERLAGPATLSDRGRVVRELDDPNLRQLVIRRYRLIYRVTEREIHIEALIHGARDFARWRKSGEGMTN